MKGGDFGTQFLILFSHMINTQSKVSVVKLECQNQFPNVFEIWIILYGHGFCFSMWHSSLEKTVAKWE